MSRAPYDSSRRPLLVGPGHRLAALEPLLGVLATREVYRIGTLRELLGQTGSALLDGELVAREDLGLLEAALDASPVLEVEVVGGEPAGPALLRLCAHPRVRWSPWPVDTERLQRWAAGEPASTAPAGDPDRAPLPAAPPAPVLQAEAESAPPPRAKDPELEEIERILGALGEPSAPPKGEDSGGPDPFDAAPPEAFLPELDAAELEALQGSPLEPYLQSPAEAPSQAPAPSSQATAPVSPEPVGSTPVLPTRQLPSWYRDQVADLADMAQRLDLGLRRALESAGVEESDAALEDLSKDVLRLGQFTRTLSYLAAPPGPGGQEVDLSALAADFLSTMADEGDEAPRMLFRSDPSVRVKADKGLLVLVLDAVLTLAALAAGPAGEVRVAVHAGASDATLDVQFASGPLAGLSDEQFLEPYALHRLIPGVGPNAIPAAAAILAGQGGSLSVTSREDQRVCRLELPLA